MTDTGAACPICRAVPTSLSLQLYDDRYGFPGLFPVRVCTGCGHHFVHSSFTPAQVEELYSSYYPRATFDPEAYRPHREARGFLAWLDGERRSAYCHVPEKIRVLDIGCGFCESLGYHEGRGCEAYGVETDRNVESLAREHGFKVQIGLFDPSLYRADFFDYVTLDQVIEHCADPVATLEGVARVLKPQGRVVVATPNGRGLGARLFGGRWINWHAPYHLHIFSERSLEIAAGKGGLRVVKKRTITSSEWLFYQMNHLLLFPLEGEPSQFWSPLARRRTSTRICYAVTRLLHALKVNHLVTRLFDLLGVGDGVVYTLERR